MKIIHLTLMTALLISGCAVGPDYKRPDMSPPQQFVSQDVFALLNEGKEDNAYPTEWWYGFNDSTLNDLIDKGLAKNYDISIAAARVEQAAANIQRADSGDSLRAGTDAGIEVQERRDLDNDSSTSTSIVGGLAAVLPLDVFGKTRREVEAANAQLQSSKASLRSVILDVSTTIASEYLTLRGNQRQLELLRESVRLQENTLSIVNSRYEAGLAPELDLQRARTSVENLRADIPSLEQSLKNSRNLLATLTGEFPGFYEAVLNKQSKIPDYKSPIPHLVPYDVLTMRPDVAKAEADLKQAIANIGVAEADFYPMFELSGGVSIASSSVSGSPATDILIATLSGLIDQVLLDGGARDANLKIAAAQADEALAIYEQTLRQVGLDVENSLSALQSSLSRQQSLAKSVQSSQRSVVQAETLYQQGLISFLDVVDAQRQSAGAEQSLAREKTNYATQIANLFKSLGLATRNGE